MCNNIIVCVFYLEKCKVQSDQWNSNTCMVLYSMYFQIKIKSQKKATKIEVDNSIK